MNILNYMSEVAFTIKDRVVEMAGSRPHNIIDPTSVSSVIRHPNLPLCYSIPNGTLEIGTLISIFGNCTASLGKRFRIDFLLGKCEHCQDCGSAERQLAFHFNPRFDENSNVVVMNSFLNGQWGSEDRKHDNFSFVLDKPFQLMILVEEQHFKIAVDGKHQYEFRHRAPFNEIARMHIEGNISIDLLEFRKELRYLPGISSSSSSSSSASAGANSDGAHRRSKIITTPTIPYVEFDSNLGKPCDIYIAGMLPNKCKENFVIDFGHNDQQPSGEPMATVLAHISIRVDPKIIVRNTKKENVWGEEELYLDGPFPFSPGTHFDLVISNKHNKLAVAINGQPAFEFAHRIDPRMINTLSITGSVVLTSVRFEFQD